MASSPSRLFHLSGPPKHSARRLDITDDQVDVYSQARSWLTASRSLKLLSHNGGKASQFELCFLLFESFALWNTLVFFNYQFFFCLLRGEMWNRNARPNRTCLAALYIDDLFIAGNCACVWVCVDDGVKWNGQGWRGRSGQVGIFCLYILYLQVPRGQFVRQTLTRPDPEPIVAQL